MQSNSIQKLISLFTKLPTVGPRTASRFAFYLTKLSQEELNDLSESIKNIKNSIRVCPSCYNIYDSSMNLNNCEICLDNTRDRSLLCIVEKETDLSTIEETKTYNGLYFVLGGTINLRKDNQIRINELKERIKNSNFVEIIIAVNPTTEGEATRLLIERELKPSNIKITHLGRGLPVGGELEYADPETLESAFQSRN